MKGRVVVLKEYTKPFVIEEYDPPDPEPGAVLLRITQAGICGSDLHRWRGDISTPLPPSGFCAGHEGAGVIAKLGPGVTHDWLGQPIKEGDRLMYTSIKPCLRCYQCINGNENWCSTPQKPRVAGEWPYFHGTYADYYYISPNQAVFAVPPELPDHVLSFVNCAMGTVTEGLDRAGCKEGDYVVIQGAGGLGLNATAMAKDMGAHKIIVLDRLEKRLELAREFGASHTINIEEYDTQELRVERIREITEGRLADIVMELVGHPGLLIEGLDYLGNGGVFVEIGDIMRGRKVPFDATRMNRAKKIIGSAMFRPSLLPVMMEMLVKNRGRWPYEKIISNVFPLDDINTAFEQAEWVNRQTQVTRAVLVP